MNGTSFIFKKEVDWSALHMGVNIPDATQDVFLRNLRINLTRGERRKVKLIIDNEEYHATLFNISFDTKKYPTHKDLVQIRYSPNSAAAKALRIIFCRSYEYLSAEKAALTKKRKPISVPIENREYLVIYATPIDDVLYIECITKDYIDIAKEAITAIEEIELEQLMQTDSRASLIEREKLIKIRNLDKSIGDTLKAIYEYKCQICGLYIGEQYNARVVHTHHIEYFSISLNNDASNILVVCPNHHGIIHATNPCFNRFEKAFHYPNGYTEKLRLNIHL